MNEGPTMLFVMAFAALLAWGVTGAVYHINRTEEIKRGWFEHNGQLYRAVPVEARP